MILILLTVTLAGLKFFADFMENVSWWWVAGMFFMTLLWFEFFERLFGFDKKQAHKRYEELVEKRIKRTFKTKK